MIPNFGLGNKVIKRIVWRLWDVEGRNRCHCVNDVCGVRANSIIHMEVCAQETQELLDRVFRNCD